MKLTWLIVFISWTVSVAASPTKQVELFIAAYNQHDIEKMLEKTTQEVKWLYNINDNLVIETEGKDALRTAMNRHFKQHSNARSQIKQSLTLGETVVVIEEAFSNDGASSQCALSIYQMKHKLIQSVTYYAATTCD
ncbi:nuclear transport factor 2 family protein [uncultured Paraglaciecola sp.]|uniref:nuclear transport factor 2 family protein n=1 Tax=uncultured Paraglaciecola sp. TaxID=1765024 RepID=UPI0030D6FE54|tara:strand:- start:95564 stop:95971 length:408 start_codon:yes stop_codon:yes gene_type:complete